jgi:hypothetical protein
MKQLLLFFLVSQSCAFGMGSAAIHESLSKKEVAKDVIGAQIVNFLQKKYASLYPFHMSLQEIKQIKSLLQIQTLLSATKGVKQFTQEHKDQALFYTVKMLNDELVRLFLEAGANPNHLHRDKEGWQQYPIFAAITGTHNTQILHLLLEYGADPNIRENGGQLPIWTPLMKATHWKRPEAVNLLIQGVASNKKLSDLEKIRTERASYLSLLPTDLIKSHLGNYLRNQADLSLYNQGQLALDIAKERLGYWRRRGWDEQKLSGFKEIIKLLEERIGH